MAEKRSLARRPRCSANLVTGLFGAQDRLAEGRFVLNQLPLLLAPSRTSAVRAGRALWGEAPRGWFAGADSDIDALA